MWVCLGRREPLESPAAGLCGLICGKNDGRKTKGGVNSPVGACGCSRGASGGAAGSCAVDCGQQVAAGAILDWMSKIPGLIAT